MRNILSVSISLLSLCFILIGDAEAGMGFDGVDQFIIVPDSSDFDFDGDFTIALWPHLDVIGNDNELVCHFTPSGSFDGWSLRVLNGAVQLWDGASYKAMGTYPDELSPHCLIVSGTAGGATGSTFVDGVQVTNGVALSSDMANGNADLRIGRTTSDLRETDGNIYRVMLWKGYRFSEDDARTYYNSQGHRWPADKPPSGWWDGALGYAEGEAIVDYLKDLSGNGNEGTFVGNARTTNDESFETSASGHVTFGTNAFFDVAEPFAVSFWYKSDDHFANAVFPALCFLENTESADNWKVGLNGNNASYRYLFFGNASGIVRAHVDDISAVNTGVWNFALIRFDGVDDSQLSSFYCNLNGTNATFSSAGSFGGGGGTNEIGRDPAGAGSYWTGEMRNFAVWTNTVPSQSDATNIYALGSVGDVSGYPSDGLAVFFDASVNPLRIIDRSGNGNHGTATNGVTVASPSQADAWSDLVSDVSGNGLTGTLVNDPIIARDADGWYVALDGVDQKVTAGQALTDYPFTLSANVKLDAAANNNTLLSVSTGTDTYYHSIALFEQQGGAARASAISFTATGAGLAEGDFDALDDEIHRVVGVFPDSSNRLIYVDGVLLATETTEVGAGLAANVTAIGVSADSTPFGYTEGNIYEATIYPSALSSNQIANWESGADPTNALAAKWTFQPLPEPIPKHKRSRRR